MNGVSILGIFCTCPARYFVGTQEHSSVLPKSFTCIRSVTLSPRIFAHHAIFICALALQYVFGIKDTLTCLDMGAVETLLVWENLDCDRYEVRCWNGVIGVPHWLCGVCGKSVAAPMCGRREGDVCKHVISVMWCGFA